MYLCIKLKFQNVWCLKKVSKILVYKIKFQNVLCIKLNCQIYLCTKLKFQNLWCAKLNSQNYLSIKAKLSEVGWSGPGIAPGNLDKVI